MNLTIAPHARAIAHTLGLGRDAMLLLTTELARRHSAGRQEGHRQATREWAIRLWEARFGELDIHCLRQLILGPSEHAGAVLDAVVHARTPDELRLLAGLSRLPTPPAPSAFAPRWSACGPAALPKVHPPVSEGCAPSECRPHEGVGPTQAQLHPDALRS